MDLTAGFVLMGGRSSRMGRDKALLPVAGSSLLERTAQLVRAAAGSVTLVGTHLDDPGRYAHLGLPMVADLVADSGPIGGLLTALSVTSADWNLIVACDMPGLTADFLGRLLAAAIESGTACLVPETTSGLHPLCAVYHRRTRSAVESAIDRKCFKMHDLLKALEAVSWPIADAALVQNVNTPAEWKHLQGAR